MRCDALCSHCVSLFVASLATNNYLLLATCSDHILSCALLCSALRCERVACSRRARGSCDPATRNSLLPPNCSRCVLLLIGDAPTPTPTPPGSHVFTRLSTYTHVSHVAVRYLLHWTAYFLITKTKHHQPLCTPFLRYFHIPLYSFYLKIKVMRLLEAII